LQIIPEKLKSFNKEVETVLIIAGYVGEETLESLGVEFSVIFTKDSNTWRHAMGFY